MFVVDKVNFQTPPEVAAYMASFLRKSAAYNDQFVLEPTPGNGNLVRALEKVSGVYVDSPSGSFWDYDLPRPRYDWVVMNPPFNPVKEMESFVNQAMELSYNVIALLPWTYIINSERRLETFNKFGFAEVIFLPRKTFPGCRVQVAIFRLKKNHIGNTIFTNFTW